MHLLYLPFKQLLKRPVEVLVYELVNDLRHSLFHLLDSLITTACERRVSTIGRVRNYVDAHLGQIVSDKDRVLD